MNLSYGFENYSINSTSEAFVVWYINEIFTLKDGYNFNLGNPNLKPESAWSYEGTVEFYPTDGLVFLVGIFRTDATDLIENVDTGVWGYGQKMLVMLILTKKELIVYLVSIYTFKS